MDELGDDTFDPVAALAGPLMKKVLNDVALERQRQDGQDGFFRDFADGTAGRALHGPTVSRDRDAAREATRRRSEAERHGKITWRHQLDEAHGFAVEEGNEVQLRARLVALAAVSVAWVEAIDRRKDEKRIEKKIRAQLPLFERIRQWWKAWRRDRKGFV